MKVKDVPKLGRHFIPVSHRTTKTICIVECKEPLSAIVSKESARNEGFWV